MMPVVGEYRYGGDTVCIGIGHYEPVTRGMTRSKRPDSRVFKITRVELTDVTRISDEYDYVSLGWNEAHNMAFEDAKKRGWK
jgi:hypothetical protein